MADGGDEIVLLFERFKKVLTRTVTAKAEEKSIKDDDYVSPAGIHKNFNSSRSFPVLNLGFILSFQAM